MAKSTNFLIEGVRLVNLANKSSVLSEKQALSVTALANIEVFKAFRDSCISSDYILSAAEKTE